MGRKLKGNAKGIRALKSMYETHKKAEEEYEGVVATLQSQITNYVGLEKTPTLTEDRLEFLDGKIAGIKGIMTSDAFLKAFTPLQAVPANFAVHQFIYKLRTLFLKIHKDNHLRVHSELAFNIGCNMADVIVVERFLVRKWFATRPSMGGLPGNLEALDRLPFPPIVLLVTFIFITPLGMLNSIFHTALEAREEHGSPPTFANFVLNAVGKSDWPVLVNWVGTLSIILTLSIWFPEIDKPMTLDLDKALEEGGKATFPFLTGVATAYDKQELDVVDEHRLGIIQALKGRKRGKKKAAAAGGDKGAGAGGGAKQSAKAAAAKQAEADAVDDRQIVSRLPICIPKAKEDVPPSPTPVPTWRQRKEEAERTEPPPMDAGVYDLSDLVLCPQARKIAPKEGLLGPLLGGAARLIAKVAAMPQDVVVAFTPFTSLHRPPPAQRRQSEPHSLPAGLLEERPPVIRQDVEWHEVYGAHLLPDIDLYIDDSDSQYSGGRISRPRTAPPMRREPGGSRPRLFRELTESDEELYKTWLADISRFALAARETSERLNKRLHEKLREPFCCTRHIYEQLKYYCPENRAIICSQCTNEKYSGKAVTLLTHHCSAEIARFTRKEEELKMLVRAAGGLAKNVPIDKADLHKHVDDEIDALINALNERREHLHKDINLRQASETKTVKEEMKICLAEKKVLDESTIVLDGLATGNTRALPPTNPLAGVLLQECSFSAFWEMATAKLHQPMGIPTLLALLLPAEELMKNADRLDWSVPKQYLSNRVYPPPGSQCPTLPTQVSTTLSTVKCNTTERSEKLVRKSPAYWARIRDAQEAEELRTNDVANHLESLWGLVYSRTWRRGLTHLFTKYQQDVADILEGKTDTSRIQTYKDFFHEYRRQLQVAINMHVADGKYLCLTHRGTVTFKDILDDLGPLRAKEKQRLVCVDTIEAARSLTEFVAFVGQYHIIYWRESIQRGTPQKGRRYGTPQPLSSDALGRVDSSSLYHAPLGKSRRDPRSGASGKAALAGTI